MLKNILNLEGALKLSNEEQKDIKGGKLPPAPACQEGGYQTSVNICLCGVNGGVFNTATYKCSIAPQPTGWVWENATGCCYNFS